MYNLCLMYLWFYWLAPPLPGNTKITHYLYAANIYSTSLYCVAGFVDYLQPRSIYLKILLKWKPHVLIFQHNQKLILSTEQPKRIAFCPFSKKLNDMLFFIYCASHLNEYLLLIVQQHCSTEFSYTLIKCIIKWRLVMELCLCLIYTHVRDATFVIVIIYWQRRV